MDGLTDIAAPSTAITGEGRRERLTFPCGVCAQTLVVHMRVGESRWVLCAEDGARHRLWNTEDRLYVHCAEDCDLCIENAHGRNRKSVLWFDGPPPH